MKKTIITLACALAAAACGNSNSTQEEALPVTGATEVAEAMNITGKWTIDMAMGTTTEGSDETPFICFTDSSSVNGNLSVNNFFGDYTLNGEELTISNVGMTMMLGQSMNIEKAVIEALNNTATIKVEHNKAVILNAAKDTVMVLTKVEEE